MTLGALAPKVYLVIIDHQPDLHLLTLLQGKWLTLTLPEGVLGQAADFGVGILQELAHNRLGRPGIRRKGGTNRRIGATSQEFRYCGDIALLVVILDILGNLSVYPAPVALDDLGKGRFAKLTAL